MNPVGIDTRMITANAISASAGNAATAVAAKNSGQPMAVTT